MNFSAPTLTGRDVILRPLLPDDAFALAEAAAESREHYRFNPVPAGIEQAAQYVSKAITQRDNGERMPFTILYLQRVVGTTSYANFEMWKWPPETPQQRSKLPDAVEIGYTWLAASAQRTRCNTEAKFLLLQHAFEKWQAHRVSLRTDERNERSRRAIERLGAQFEGIRRADMPAVDGSVRNSAYYSIVQNEWADVSARLKKHLGGTAPT